MRKLVLALLVLALLVPPLVVPPLSGSQTPCEGQCWEFQPEKVMIWVGPTDGREDIFQGDPISLHRSRSGWRVKFRTTVPGSVEICVGILTRNGEEVFQQSSCTGVELQVAPGKFTYFIPEQMRTETDREGFRFAPSGGFRWKPQSGFGYLAPQEPAATPTATATPTPTPEPPTATPFSLLPLVLLILAFLLAGAGAIWLLRRRRRRTDEVPTEEQPEGTEETAEPEEPREAEESRE